MYQVWGVPSASYEESEVITNQPAAACPPRGMLDICLQDVNMLAASARMPSLKVHRPDHVNYHRSKNCR